jgi:hypothetical protein
MLLQVLPLKIAVGGDDRTASSAPSSAPTSQGDLQLEYFVGVALPDYTRAALTRTNSPQTMALSWLQNNTDLESYSLSRRLQRFALATFYFSTGGSKRWIKDYGWLTDQDECTWFSSEIDSPICKDNVFKVLSLQSNGLRGTIAPEISLLSSLELLRVNENIITGFLPSTIGDLIDLKEIRLCKFISSVFYILMCCPLLISHSLQIFLSQLIIISVGLSPRSLVLFQSLKFLI